MEQPAEEGEEENLPAVRAAGMFGFSIPAFFPQDCGVDQSDEGVVGLRTHLRRGGPSPAADKLPTAARLVTCSGEGVDGEVELDIWPLRGSTGHRWAPPTEGRPRAREPTERATPAPWTRDDTWHSHRCPRARDVTVTIRETRPQFHFAPSRSLAPLSRRDWDAGLRIDL